MRDALPCVLLLSACGTAAAPASRPPLLATSELQVALTPGGGIEIDRPDGGVILSSVTSASPGFVPFLWADRGEQVVMNLGQFGFIEGPQPWTAASIAGAGTGGDGGTVTFPLSGGGTLALSVVDEGTLAVTLTPPAGAKSDETGVAFACGADDHFLGFGEQTNALDQKGLAFGTWTMEDGLGKKPGETHTNPNAIDPTGNTNDSYFPMPSFLDPRGFGLVVDGTRYVQFDLCSTRADAFRVDAWNGTLSFHLVFGDSPAELVARLTALTGRQPLSVPWTYGVWVDAVEGEQRVRTVAAELRDAGVPASVIWTEDWAGESNGASFNSFGWTPDETLYPQFSQLADSVHYEGYKWLGYFNSFVIQGTDIWDQGADAGTLVQSPDGGPYVFTGSALTPTGLVDLTNPKATAWMGAAMEKVARAGMDGWMADFGEWLPYDAVMADGTTGAQTHERFPLLWAKLNHDALSAAIPSGDFVFFTRSGWTGMAAVTPAMWAGDQNTDWGVDDGLPSVLPMGMNMGLQGLAAWGSDIGGYSAIISPPSTKELYLRWAEVGAFSPIMRTHHGYQQNLDWLFDRDAETLAIFGKFATEHIRLFPYLYTLAGQTPETGIGVLRPVWFDFPGDPRALTLLDEYLLGDGMLVAPVVTQGATSRDVYFPAGHWMGWFGPDAHDGPGDAVVAAPIDACPVYALAGTLYPRLPPGVQTLVAAQDPTVQTLAQAGGELWVRAFLGAPGSFSAYDGTVLAMESAAGAQVTQLSACSPPGGSCASPLPSCASGVLPCGDIDAPARQATVAARGQDLEFGAGEGGTIEVHAPGPKKVTVEIRW